MVSTFALALATMMPSAVVAIPLVGRLLDRSVPRGGGGRVLSLKVSGYQGGMFLCNLTGVLYGLLSLIPRLLAQWATLAVLSLHRILLFASLFAYRSLNPKP